LLNFGKDAKSTHLETSGYKKDTAGEMDSLEKNASMIASVMMGSIGLNVVGKEEIISAITSLN
jgi:hypothetical protein